MTKRSVLYLRNIQTLVEEGREAVKKTKDGFSQIYLFSDFRGALPATPSPAHRGGMLPAVVPALQSVLGTAHALQVYVQAPVLCIPRIINPKKAPHLRAVSMCSNSLVSNSELELRPSSTDFLQFPFSITHSIQKLTF